MVGKYVITGGPCSGKSTVINELRSRGYNVLEEVAREVLTELGRPNCRDEVLRVQKEIFRRQLLAESACGEYFLDRGLIDNFAYSRHFLGKVPEEFENFDKNNLRTRYDSVFILDLLPFKDDGLRIESGHEEAQRVHSLLIDAYSGFGYKPIFVPTFPGDIEGAVKKRADFIISHSGGKND